jgi:serine/threonine protein kinase
MTTASSPNFGSKPASRFNGAQCPVCQRQFRDGEIVCPVDMELLIPAVIDPLQGTVIDKKYRLHSVSGRGATGRVYKATHEAIGRTVAVKVVDAPQDTVSSKSVERLRREARALSLVNHPNLPRLFDAGELPDGSTYLVLDYTEGCSLLSKIEENGCIPAAELIPIIGQICDALEHLHAHGMIHRDVKPENILLLNHARGRTTVKLIDLGICKFDDVVTEEGSALSIEFAGSPLYMSPEHVNGMLVDRRSDIYSLGATVYHALCGKPPLSESNLVDMIHAHRSVMPSPISFVAPHANVPLSVEGAVFRALQKLPGNRYQTAAEMKMALVQSLTPEAYTGKLSHLEFSGAELRAMAAFIKSASMDEVQRLLELDGPVALSVKSSLLSKIRSALHQIESLHSPTGKSLQELSLEHTLMGEQETADFD